jgi:hypothetical protein
LTIEGLAQNGKLDPLQEAFWNEHAAMRNLYARDDSDGAPTAGGPSNPTSRRSATDSRESVPLYRLPAHRQRGEDNEAGGRKHGHHITKQETLFGKRGGGRKIRG